MKHVVLFISCPPSFSFSNPLSLLLCVQLFPFSFPVFFSKVLCSCLFPDSSLPRSPSLPAFLLSRLSSIPLSSFPTILGSPFPFLVYFSFSFWIPFPFLQSTSSGSPIISFSVTLFLLHHRFSSCAVSNYSWHPCLLASFFFSHLLFCLPFCSFSFPPPPPFTIICILSFLSFLMLFLLFLFSSLTSFFLPSLLLYPRTQSSSYLSCFLPPTFSLSYHPSLSASSCHYFSLFPPHPSLLSSTFTYLPSLHPSLLGPIRRVWWTRRLLRK